MNYKFLIIFLIVSLFGCLDEENNTKNIQINDPDYAKDFAIKNVDEINKIIMKDKEGNIILLEKSKDQWLVNKKYDGWKEVIDYRLKTLKNIRIQSSVSEKKEEQVIKQLAKDGVKIEIYTNDLTSPNKTYYVGGNTPNHLGTYMIMKGSQIPYIMHIPGKPGLLAPKFGIDGNKLDILSWRKRITISINPNSIESIEVKDFDNLEQSFYIDRINNTVKNKAGQVLLSSDNCFCFHSEYITVKEYLGEFEELKCGAYVPKLKKSDLIISKKISIKHHGKSDVLEIFKKNKTVNTNEEFNANIEIAYASWNGSEIVMIQENQEFNKVLITLDQLQY